MLARHVTDGQVYDLWVDGYYAFVAEGWEGLRIVDVSQPGETFAVGRVPTRGEARGVEVQNNRIYLAEAGGGLAILALPTAAVTILEQPASISAMLGGEAILRVRAFGREALTYQWFRGESGDISQPVPGATGPTLTIPETSELTAYWVRVSGASAFSDSQTAWVRPVAPVSIELLSLWPGCRRGTASDVVARGNLAYVAAGGLQIWDVADAASPRIAGSYDPNGAWASVVCLSGDFALIGCGENRLDIVNVSNSAAPYQVSTYTNTYGYVNSIEAVAQTAFCLCGSRLVTLNIANPSSPRELAVLDLGSWGSSISIQGTLLYFVSYDAGLKIIDIANPQQPRVLATLATAGYARSVAVEGNYACVAEQPRWLENSGSVGGGLLVIDVSNSVAPRLAARWNTPTAQDVCVTNGLAWLADGSAGLKVFDLRRPAYLELIGTNATWAASSIAVSGPRAFATTGDSGVQVLDIRQASAPTTVGFLQTYGYSQSVAVSGHYAYLGDGSPMWVLDITNPRRPVPIGSYASSPQALAISGQHLYLAPFEVLDVADPRQPESIGTLEDNAGTYLALLGDTVCLSSGWDLRTVDASNPTAPRILANVSIGNVTSISAWNNLAYVACDSDGLAVFDLTAPASPRKVGNYLSDNPVMDVAVSGNCGYLVVSGNPGLERLDLADPQRPVLTGKISMPAAMKAAPMAGSYACVAGGGLQVVDFGDPTQPVRVGQHPLTTPSLGLQVVGDLAFVAAGDYGLAIYRLTPQLKLNRPVFEGTELRLSWLGSPGVRLQRTASLANPDWQDLPNTDGASAFRLPASNASGFFRLVRK